MKFTCNIPMKIVFATSAFSRNWWHLRSVTYFMFGFTFRWWHAIERSIPGISSEEHTNISVFTFKHLMGISFTIERRLILIMNALAGLISNCTFQNWPYVMGLLNIIIGSRDNKFYAGFFA
ncbi:hypothetical protein QL285_019441 [Trifolium repens]|nr:hypothetical protein QL285_019441 [Trifolium repens]